MLNSRRERDKELGENPLDIFQAALDFLRICTGIVGLTVLVTGLCIAVSAFGVIRGLVQTPDGLMKHLDQWASGPKTIEPEKQPEAESKTDRSKEKISETDGSPRNDADKSKVINVLTGETAETAQTEESRQKASSKPSRSSRHEQAIRSKGEADWTEAALAFVDMFRSGHMARPIGAVCVLLFAVLLAKIPISLIHVGLTIVKAMVPEKKHTI